MKHFITTLFVFVLVLGMVSADAGHPEHTGFEQAEGIINAEIPCDSLSDEQLELLGDYYMEQMHPGVAHTRMDEMMGGEGSEALRDMHIRMAKAFYCGESDAMDVGMMNRMVGMMGSGMMGSPVQSKGGGYTMMGHDWGMMGGTGWLGMSLLWLVYVALAAFVFGIIFWWTKKLMYPDKRRR